jgi:hypothetical protein
MITKKHLKELADIVHMAQSHAQADLEGVAQEILSFARRHAPNFSQSHWDDYMHKLKKAEDKPEPNKQYRLTSFSPKHKGQPSIANGNTWAESEIK